MTQAASKNDAVYFAYGTLLDINGMKKYCPSAKPLGVMRLKGYRMGFALCGADPSVGGCTLVEDAAHTMYGVLYSLPAKELADLDAASGVDRGLWATIKITLTDEKGQKVPANTLTIPDPAGPYRPPETYTTPIMVGAKAWPLPATYIKQLEGIIRDA
ncbi:MAG: gamma-glutamylcyclotransferase family protein [Deltaproteobacteria bacterium]